MYICICICMYVCMYVCIYIYIYTYIHVCNSHVSMSEDAGFHYQSNTALYSGMKGFAWLCMDIPRYFQHQFISRLPDLEMVHGRLCLRSKSPEVGACLVDSFKKVQKLAPSMHLDAVLKALPQCWHLRFRSVHRGHGRRSDQTSERADVRHHSHCLLPRHLPEKAVE